MKRKKEEKEKIEELSKIAEIIENIKEYSIEELLTEDSEEIEELNKLVETTLAIKDIGQPPPETKEEVTPEVTPEVKPVKIPDKYIGLLKVIDDKVYFVDPVTGKPIVEFDKVMLDIINRVDEAYLVIHAWNLLRQVPSEQRLLLAKSQIEVYKAAKDVPMVKAYEALIATDFDLKKALYKIGEFYIVTKLDELARINLMNILSGKFKEISDILTKYVETLSKEEAPHLVSLANYLKELEFEIVVEKLKVTDIRIPKAREVKPYVVLMSGLPDTPYEGINYLFVRPAGAIKESPAEAYGKIWWILTRYHPLYEVFADVMSVEALRFLPHHTYPSGVFPSLNWEERLIEERAKYKSAYFNVDFFEATTDIKDILSVKLGRGSHVMVIESPLRAAKDIFEITDIVSLKDVKGLREEYEKISKYFMLENLPEYSEAGLTIEDGLKVYKFYIMPEILVRKFAPNIPEDVIKKTIRKAPLITEKEAKFALYGRIVYLHRKISDRIMLIRVNEEFEVAGETFKLTDKDKALINILLNPTSVTPEEYKKIKETFTEKEEEMKPVYTKLRKLLMAIQKEIIDLERDAALKYRETTERATAYVVSKLGINPELPDIIEERVKAKLRENGYSIPERPPTYVKPMSIETLIESLDDMLYCAEDETSS